MPILAIERSLLHTVPSLPPALSTAPPDWRTSLADSYTRLEDLLVDLGLSAEDPAFGLQDRTGFPFRVTRQYAARMRKGDAADPLLRQVLPLADETIDSPGYLADPVGDLAAVATPGVLHKYRGRALLVTTGACAIHCRYCFRREFPYGDGQVNRQRQTEALAYLAADESVSEVILSGGDPLVLSDRRLAELIAELDAVPHIKRLRIHTRLPIVLPQRVTPELCDLLRDGRLQTVVVIHANHAQEFDASVGNALADLHAAGVTLLNQAVLLRAVNDDVETLAELSETLFAHRVLPYYLHLLDKARGTAHFDVPEADALALHEGLRRRLPGYLVPRLVREEAGKPYKSWRI